MLGKIWFVVVAAWAAGPFAALSAPMRDLKVEEDVAQPVVRLEMGMPIAAVHQQPAIAAQPIRFSPNAPSLILLRQPHRLELAVNGKVIALQGGGGMAATWIKNGFRLKDDLRLEDMTYDRVSMIRFDLGPALIPLKDAIDVAQSACDWMRRASFSPQPKQPFGAVSHWAGAAGKPELNDFAGVERAFLDTQTGAETVLACKLTDGSVAFEVEIRNYRRARQTIGGSTEADIQMAEAGRATEAAYRVTGSLLWEAGE